MDVYFFAAVHLCSVSTPDTPRSNAAYLPWALNGRSKTLLLFLTILRKKAIKDSALISKNAPLALRFCHFVVVLRP